MRGIRFIKVLNKEFNLLLITKCKRLCSDGKRTWVVYTDSWMKNALWFYSTYISGWIWNRKENKRKAIKFKYSEKYKIKQLLYQALSYSK